MKKKPAKKTRVSRRRVRVQNLREDPEWKKQHDEYHAKQEAQALEQMKLVERFVVAFERIASASERKAGVQEKQNANVEKAVEEFKKQLPDLFASLTGSKLSTEVPS